MSETETYTPDLERIAADAGRSLERVQEFFHANTGRPGTGSVNPFEGVTDHDHAVEVVKNSLAPDPEPSPTTAGGTPQS